MLAIFSGPPGAGKTTLAKAVALVARCPLISRDEINEGIFQTYDHDPDLITKDAVAQAAFEAFFGAIEHFIARDVSIVAEAAFQDAKWRIGLEPVIASASIRVINCMVDTTVARTRIADRHRQDDPRRAKRRQTVTPKSSHAGRFERISLPVPTIDVDTSDGYRPDLESIIAFATSR